MSVPKNTVVDGKEFDRAIFEEQDVKEDPNLNKVTTTYIEGRDIHRYYIDRVRKYVNIQGIDAQTKEWHLKPKIVLQRIVGQNKSKIFASIDLDNKIVFPNANLVNANQEATLSTILA